MHRLPHERVVRKLDVARTIVLTHHLSGEHRRQQVFPSHALDRHGHPLASAEAQQCQRAGRVPAPAIGEHRNRQGGLDQRVFKVVGSNELERVTDWKAVLLTQREHESVIGGGRLKFEVKRHAEPFPHGQTPGAVDPRPVWRMYDELHAPRFVEEALGNNGLFGGHGTQCGHRVRYVRHQLLGPT